MTPLEPRQEQIFIEDIAHALSLMTRANGHFPDFYSVAQHCIACYQEAKARKYTNKVMLACLLHDASEAYIADITRPIKHYLSEYLTIEERLQSCIYQKYLQCTITNEEMEQIAMVDDALLSNEFYYYMNEDLFEQRIPLMVKICFETLPFKTVEEEYLFCFKEAYEAHLLDLSIL